MTCDEFRERLTAFDLGELAPAEAAAAREHVADCAGCTNAVLLDRQLTAVLRSSAVPAPPGLRTRVRAALRDEAARREGRRRHWLAFGSAAALAAAVLAAAVLLVPAPNRSSPLAAAWSAYRSEPVIRVSTPTGEVGARMVAVLGQSARPPDLTRFGLAQRGWGARDLAGHLASVAEYRDAAGHRIVLMRWRGELPSAAGRSRGRDVEEFQLASWQTYGSAWWRQNGVVWCAIGTVDQRTLYSVAEHLYGES